MNSITLTLPNERPQSWNKSYAGQHWTKRKDEVERVRLAVRKQIDPDTVEVFAGQVDVDVSVYFAGDPQDADNIPAKLYVDALKGWYIADDDRHHVRSVRTWTLVDKADPRVVIRISPVKAERQALADGGAALVSIGEGCHHA